MKFLLSTTIVFLLCSFSGLENQKDIWVNETYANMSEDERIGQLFMIRAHSDKTKEHILSVKSQIKKYHVGSLCFFQGTPEKQIKLTNEYQLLSKTPLMIAMDAEWGLGMRLKNSFSFPRQLTLGAIQDNQLIENMGEEIGKHLRAVGSHINFAPVADVNNNPANPVINNRSFGEDKYNVSAKSIAYMKGLQKANVLACAKHFPGHGDTDADSHYDLPIINHSRNRLDDLELYPFKELSDNGIGSMMIAHLHVPAFDARAKRPSTLSSKTIKGVLQQYIGFNGIIFTDALEMQGVAKNFKPGVMEVEALLAGNDVLVLPIDIDIAFNTVKKALQDGVLSWTDIEVSVKKILSAKYDLGLQIKPSHISSKDIDKKVNNQEATVIKSKLIEKALTLVRNDEEVIPVRNLHKKYASLSIGVKSKSVFQDYLSRYTSVKDFQIEKDATKAKVNGIINELSKYDHIFISLHDMSKYASKDFGLSQDQLDIIYQLNTQNKVSITVFGSPYALKYFSTIPTILLAYEEGTLFQQIAAEAIFGAHAIMGKLPVTAHEIYPANLGLQTPNLLRLAYSIPEYVGMSSDSLLAIDSIVKVMLKEKAAPGCQILVAKDGKIVFNKAYGHHTTKKKRKVELDDIYDIASVTKVMASTLSLMKLQDEGKFHPSNKIKDYLNMHDTINKRELVMEDVLAHHAQLAAWVPFYISTMSTGKRPKVLDKYYSKTPDNSFGLKVTDNLFLRNDYRDSIYHRIMSTQLKPTRRYKYSDLAFYISHLIINKLSDEWLEDYVQQIFYRPLGLSRTLFKPKDVYDLKEIVPTEEDSYFRNQTIHGHVHDMGAAMLGGVSGHAGLFSTASELAILGQMLLNGGYYGGQQYLSPQVIKQYTSRHKDSTRRGLGFDMKELNPDKKMNMSEKATESTFGHLGFTGTAVWMDPENNMIFVILANRTYPSMHNNKFGKNNYRPKIHTVLYNALMN